MYNFYSDCVSWPEAADKEGGLMDMVDNDIDITRSTFLKHINREDLADLEQQLSYSAHPAQGLTMAADWAVSYHRSKLHGKRVYYFQHSAIEYVFI